MAGARPTPTAVLVARQRSGALRTDHDLDAPVPLPSGRVVGAAGPGIGRHRPGLREAVDLEGGAAQPLALAQPGHHRLRPALRESEVVSVGALVVGVAFDPHMAAGVGAD